MATIDCTLADFKVPGLSSYANAFGTKKEAGEGLTTAECVDVTMMPFNRQRPFTVTETSSTTEVQANSVFKVTASGVTLTIADAAYDGCTALVANASSGAITVKGGASGLNGSTSGVTLASGAVLSLLYCSGWLTVSATGSGGSQKAYGTAEAASYTGITSTGAITASGNITSSGQLKGATLSVTGTSSQSGAITAGSTITASGNITSSGQLKGATLSVTGASTLSGAVTAGSNVTASGYVTGSQIVTPTSAPSTLTNGSVWLEGTTYIKGRYGGATYGAPLYSAVDAAVDGVWHVYTLAGLKAWAAACSSDMSLSCVLHDNIDFSGESWTPVGTSSNPYSGSFDGGGHSITNWVHSSSSNNQGFFGRINGGEVRNLHIHASCSISAVGAVGGIAGRCDYGAITGCSNAASITASSGNSGGIAGRCDYAQISNCVNSGAVSGTQYVGGVTGACDYVQISNCSNSGAVSASGTYYCGGVAGGFFYGAVSNCSNSGAVTGLSRVGGVVGYTQYADTSNCSNSGTITASGGESGGVVGYASTSSFLHGCENSGTVTASGDYVGGMTGVCVSSSSIPAVVSCCSNTGDVTAASRIGGIAGETRTSAMVTCCANRGTISGTGSGSYTTPGGIIGVRYSSGTIQYCASVGSTTTQVGTQYSG